MYFVDEVSEFHITTPYHPIIRILPSEEVRTPDGRVGGALGRPF
jgi:hypothetical protein